MDYFDDVAQAIQDVEEIEAEDKEFRKLQRLNDCGKYAWYFSGETGEQVGYVKRCGLFRECPSCLQYRVKQEREWIEIKLLNTEMVTVTINDLDKANNLVRKAHKTQFIRYPQLDDTDLFLLNKAFAKKHEINGTPVTSEWLQAQDWKEILNTPVGRNKSGTMHVPKSPKPESKFSIIQATQIVTNAENTVVICTMNKAIKSTAAMDPKTADEVVDCLNLRMGYVKRALQEQGYEVHEYIKKQKVNHNAIDWQKSRSINMPYTENSTRGHRFASDKPPNLANSPPIFAT